MQVARMNMLKIPSDSEAPLLLGGGLVKNLQPRYNGREWAASQPKKGYGTDSEPAPSLTFMSAIHH